MRERKIDSYEVHKRYLRNDSAIVWGRKTVGCVGQSGGSIDDFVSVIEDISARKPAEELLRATPIYLVSRRPEEVNCTRARSG
jgi:hypothetical protein